MIRSGIAPLDDVFGGMPRGASFVLTGGPGSGKSTWCLHFVDSGLRNGERVAMLVHARRADVLSHARYLGIDLTPPLRDGRLLLLRYRSDFARRVANALSADRVLDDLRRLIGGHQPSRVVIDSFAPLLDDGSAAGVAASALAEYLERLGCGALLTYPGDVRAGYDRRLEPLLQNATGVLRLAREAGTGFHVAEALSLRGAAPRATTARFIVRPGDAIALVSGMPDESFAPPAHGPILLLHTTDTPSEELAAVLGRQREVVSRRATVELSPDDLLLDPCAVVVETDHVALDRAREVVRARHAEARTPPLLVAVRFNLRSIDRARLLRDGADDVLARDMGTPELLQRLAAALRRGHLTHPPLAIQEDERLTQRALADADGALLDRERFARAIALHTTHDDATPFAIVRLVAASADELPSLGDVAVRCMRSSSGDLAALLDDAVAVYLHGARRRDVAPFVDRVRAQWPAARGTLRAEAASFPGELARLRQLVEPLQLS